MSMRAVHCHVLLVASLFVILLSCNPVKPVEAASITREGPTINVLARINTARDSRTGGWAINNHCLVGTSKWKNISIGLPIGAPPQYNLRAVFARTATDNDVAIVCCVKGRQFDWDMGAYGNHIDGFEQVDGKNIINSPKSRHFAQCLKNQVRYTCLIKVRTREVRAYLDGNLIMRWKTRYRHAHPNPTWLPPLNFALGVAARSSVIFYAITLTPVQTVEAPADPMGINYQLPLDLRAQINPLPLTKRKNPNEYAPAISNTNAPFTSAAAIAAQKTYHAAENTAHSSYRRSVNAATKHCRAHLLTALQAAMTSNEVHETLRLTIIITAMKKRGFHAPEHTGFTTARAKTAWKQYTMALAVARGQFRLALQTYRQIYCTQLRKALSAAVRDNHLAEALRIEKSLKRLEPSSAKELPYGK